MGIFVRHNGEWVESAALARDGGGWTNPVDNGFVRDAGEWKQFQPGANAEFLPPENLGAAADDTSVILSWTHPEQTLEPDYIQIRIVDITPVWTEYPYPETTTTIANLDPETEYQAQARYVIRSDVDGTVTHESDIATIFFTTAEAEGPSNPAPDPNGSGPDSQVFWPPPPGGPTCNWEWVLQTPNEGNLNDWLDTAVSGTVAYSSAVTADLVDFVEEGLSCGGLARFKYRQVCGGTPGDWEYASAFVMPCDWATRCGGTTWGAAWESSPFSSAVSALPQGCMSAIDGGGFQIEDAITEIEFGRLSAYVGAGIDGSGNWFAQSRSTARASGDPLLAGRCPALEGKTDYSFTLRSLMTTQPPSDAQGGQLLARFGGRLTFRAYSEGSGVRYAVSFPASGGIGYLETDELPLDVWNRVTVTLDADGDQILYVGVEETARITVTPGLAGQMTRDIELYAGPTQELGLVGSWDRVLTEAEIFNFDPMSDYDRHVLSLGPSLFFNNLIPDTTEVLPTLDEYVAELGFDLYWSDMTPQVGDPWPTLDEYVAGLGFDLYWSDMTPS